MMKHGFTRYRGQERVMETAEVRHQELLWHVPALLLEEHIPKCRFSFIIPISQQQKHVQPGWATAATVANHRLWAAHSAAFFLITLSPFPKHPVHLLLKE